MSFDGTIGGEEQGVNDAVQNLESSKTDLGNFCDELENLSSQVSNEWLSDASAEFLNNMSRLIKTDMATIGDCVQAFKMWAEETLASYQELDRRQTESVSQI